LSYLSLHWISVNNFLNVLICWYFLNTPGGYRVKVYVNSNNLYNLYINEWVVNTTNYLYQVNCRLNKHSNWEDNDTNKQKSKYCKQLLNITFG